MRAARMRGREALSISFLVLTLTVSAHADQLDQSFAALAVAALARSRDRLSA